MQLLVDIVTNHETRMRRRHAFAPTQSNHWLHMSPSTRTDGDVNPTDTRRDKGDPGAFWWLHCLAVEEDEMVMQSWLATNTVSVQQRMDPIDELLLESPPLPEDKPPTMTTTKHNDVV